MTLEPPAYLPTDLPLSTVDVPTHRYNLRPNRSSWKTKQFNFNLSIKDAESRLSPDVVKSSVEKELKNMISKEVFNYPDIKTLNFKEIIYSHIQ
jgi:transposase-like protein